MYTMNEEEKKVREEVKALHRDARFVARGTMTHRYQLLLWGFVRGFKFRRIERSHHFQEMPDGSIFEHNIPPASALHYYWKKYLPDLKVADIEAWLEDPSGAIPAPPPRPKKPYVRPEPAAAE